MPASRAGAARAAAILLIPCHLQSARTPDAAPSSHDDDLESAKGNSWLLSRCRCGPWRAANLSFLTTSSLSLNFKFLLVFVMARTGTGNPVIPISPLL